MGRALAGGKRDKVFLMTKNCERDYEGSKRCLDESLRRLRTGSRRPLAVPRDHLRQRPGLGLRQRRHSGRHRSAQGREGPAHRLYGSQGPADPPGDARQAVRVGHEPDADQRPGRALPELPEAGRARVPDAQRRRDRDERASAAGPASRGRPGCRLRRRTATRSASRWRHRSSASRRWNSSRKTSRWRAPSPPMTPAEQTALTARVRDVAADGRFELFKSSQMFDGPVHRRQHGFAT